MLRSVRDLKGVTIGATDGDIGKVENFHFDDQSFTVRHLVVDASGWLTRHKVLISPRSIRRVDWAGSRIEVGLTKAQVEHSPDIDTEVPVGRQQELEYYRYYDYEPYWTGPYLWGAAPYPGPISGPAGSLEQERRWQWTERDQHLRRSSDVIGYYVEASDGDIGHVEDFLVDERSWSIRYMIVDTRNWWPGKKVLVSPEWVDAVDWNESKVHVSMTRAHIRESPEYDPSKPVEREYETRLFGHYRRPDYWSERRDVAA
jgi:sporulation protein YlmC with PRC-barrel domain